MTRRLAAFAAAATVTVGTVTGVALATTRSTTPIGTGVVVIDTNLAYQGGEAAGTGMVVRSNGEIVTNNHVIRGATSIRVVIPGTGHSYTARVVGYDVSDDVAVIRASGASNLKTLSIGDSATVRVGQAVTAIGNAGGTGSLTTSTGKVTGIAKSITVSDESGSTSRLAGLIETNAGLVSGDSGGPLLSSAGKVVGMDTAASMSGAGYREIASTDGYAIPINKVMTIAKAIDAGKSSAKIHVGATAFLGLSVGSAAAYQGFDVSGAVVMSVVDGGPAAKAGIEPGDVITAFAGRRVTSAASLTSLVANANVGSKVAVSFTDRSGSSRTATVTLASGPPR